MVGPIKKLFLRLPLLSLIVWFISVFLYISAGRFVLVFYRFETLPRTIGMFESGSTGSLPSSASGGYNQGPGSDFTGSVSEASRNIGLSSQEKWVRPIPRKINTI